MSHCMVSFNNDEDGESRNHDNPGTVVMIAPTYQLLPGLSPTGRVGRVCGCICSTFNGCPPRKK